MAHKKWEATIDLARHFEEQGQYYSFYNAVEIIQRHFDEGREPGTRLMPIVEPILFNVENNLNFPTSDISGIKTFKLPNIESGYGLSSTALQNMVLENQIDLSENQTRFQVSVNFLGLHGANSPLPTYYQEKVAQFDAEGSLLKDFFDFFHNRLISLLYRTMRKYPYYLQYKPVATDNYSKRIFSIFGLADDSIRSNDTINWARLLSFAGILSTRNRSPSVVATVLEYAFFSREKLKAKKEQSNQPLPNVSIDEWVFRKVDIDPSQKWSLGKSNSVLGHNAVIGDRVADIMGRFRICIENLSFERFQDFLPKGKEYNSLKKLVEFMLKDQFSYELKLGLISGHHKPLTLDTNEVGRLGWSSFVGKGQATKREVNITVRH
jgi:type VI secretion system protein ImpH